MSRASVADHIRRLEETDRLMPASDRMRIDSEKWLPTPPRKWLRFIGCEVVSRGWYVWHLVRGIDPDNRREWMPAWLRTQVIARDGLVCGICSGDVELPDVHIDHITPYSKGGADVLANLRVTHSLCNIRRGNRT